MILLNKKRKDRRVEFVKLKKEQGEELITKKNNKQLLKYFGTPAEDTF